MTDLEVQQSIIDQEHVRLLSIAYVVSACLSALFSLLPLVYVFVAVFFMSLAKHAPPDSKGPSPEIALWMFCFIGLGIFVAMMAMGVLKLLVSQRLKQRRSRMFCMVVAVLSCLEIPYGTLLGVFTFLVLARPSVIREFQSSTPPTEIAHEGEKGS